jgi:hypothetical protein
MCVVISIIVSDHDDCQINTIHSPGFDRKGSGRQDKALRAPWRKSPFHTAFDLGLTNILLRYMDIMDPFF